MASFQVTSWRDLPALVVARDGAEEAKVPLPPRFAEAIDEAAMRLGTVAADEYLAGWGRGEWAEGEGTPAEVAADVARRLEEQWSPERLAAYLDALGDARSGAP